MEIYIVSISSAILGYLSSIFANRKTKGFLPTVGIVSILAIAAAGLTFVGRWIATPSPTPPPPQPTRERNRLEGQWIERYREGDRVIFAIVTISYNSETEFLEFSGNSYDPNLNLVGHWQTIQARLEGNQFDYLYEGASFNPDISRQGHRKGVGGIWFDNNNHGRGNFFSVRTDKELREFELDRILDEKAAKQSQNDPKGLMQELYKDPSHLKKITSTNK